MKDGVTEDEFVAMRTARDRKLGAPKLIIPSIQVNMNAGRFPTPEVMVAQPVWVQRPHVVVAQPQPVYLWVPPGHQKNWSKHCSRYNACGVPVYFVKDSWYHAHVAPPPRPGGAVMMAEPQGGGPGHGHGHGRGKGHD